MKVFILLMLSAIVVACGIEPDLRVIQAGANAAPIVCGGKGGQAFAIDDHYWVTAAHVVDTCEIATIYLTDGPEPAEISVFLPDVDFAILWVETPSENPLPVCRHEAHWLQPITHVWVSVEPCHVRGSGGEVLLLRDDQSDNGPWDGMLVKSSANTYPGWSGGATLAYDSDRDETCVTGITVGGDDDKGYTWFVPSRAIRENRL